MIIAYHVVISAYGFWLPNDERGSWSDFVRNWELFRNYGSATKVSTMHSVANRPYDHARREAMRQSLACPPVKFTGKQAQAIAYGFAKKTIRSGYIIHAFAMLREHAHLVIASHEYGIEQVVKLLKGAASRELLDAGLHPFANQRDPESGRLPQVWGRNMWKVFLYDRADVMRSIEHTNENPVKEGLPPQHWSFVRPPFF